MIFVSDQWKDYELIDCGNGEKLERWGDKVLLRPDPQAIWPMRLERQPDAHYLRSSSGGGYWQYNKTLPESWVIGFNELKFIVKPTGFKHTGLFPEQAVNWSWMSEKIKSAKREIKVLNLFAYTGGASLACLSAGAEVVHVDAAKGIVGWAKDNAKKSGLDHMYIRYIVDDVLKFVKREQRRGNKYDCIIMDPPSYGRGPNGEMWKIEDSLFELVEQCKMILSDNPLFFVINSYTTGLAPTVINNVLNIAIKSEFGGQVQSGEIGLKATKRDIILPCGAVGRWWA